jgi:hypothetical protein
MKTHDADGDVPPLYYTRDHTGTITESDHVSTLLGLLASDAYGHSQIIRTDRMEELFMEANVQAPATMEQARASRVRQVKWLALSAVCGVVYFFLAVAVLHFIRRDYDPISRVMSNYAVGPYGWLMTLAFLAFAWSFFAIALGFSINGVLNAQTRTVPVLLTVASVGLVGSAIFPTDVTADDSPSTPVGMVHILLGVLSFVCFVAAALIASQRFKQDKRWQSVYPPAFALALSSLVAFAVFFVIKATQSPIGGLGQRVFLGLVLLWVFVVAVGMRQVVAQSSTQVSQSD